MSTRINATVSGLLVYLNTDLRMAAVISRDGLRKAHDAELRVGCHPYAVATAWVPAALLPALAPAMIDPADAEMIEDFMDWSDDVFERYTEHSGEESIASSAQQVAVITDARMCDELNIVMHAEDAAAARAEAGRMMTN